MLRCCSDAIPGRFPRLLVGLDIDNSLCPLAGGDLALEQDVDLAVGAVLHLGEEEEGHEETGEAGAGPDVTAPATEVGLLYLCVSKMVQRGDFGWWDHLTSGLSM